MSKFKKKSSSKDIDKQSSKHEILPPVKKQPFRFQPGNKMGGRTKGSRNRFAEKFFTDFHTDWQQHGIKAIQDCRKDDPATYLRVAASIVPKELNIKEGESILETLLEQFSAEQLDQFIAGLLAAGVAEQGKGRETKALTSRQSDGIH